MLTESLVVARKEITDHARDGRALMSSAVYAIMGPGVTALVLVAAGGRIAASSSPVLVAMASTFAVMAAFTGPLALTLDTIAGERERQSLLPLLLNPVTRLEIVFGKWMAATLFAAASVAVNILAFAVILAPTPSITSLMSVAVLAAIPAMLPLVALAAAGELLVATFCRTLKEANSYLSMLTFVVMGATMYVAVRPGAAPRWWLLPIAGHERALERAFGHVGLPATEIGVLSCISLVIASVIIVAAARLLQRESVIYGG